MAIPKFSEDVMKKCLSDTVVDFKGIAVTRMMTDLLEKNMEPETEELDDEERIRHEARLAMQDLLPAAFPVPAPFGSISLEKSVTEALKAADLGDLRSQIEQRVIDVLLFEISEIGAEKLLTDTPG